MHAPPTPTTDALSDLARALVARAGGRAHRAGLVLSGSQDWCSAGARAVIAGLRPAAALWVGAGADDDSQALSARQALGMLGRECDALVYNAWSGFDPDAFGALSGTLRGGGLMLLLCPPLADWPAFPDPQNARITLAGCDPSAVTGRFFRRLGAIIRTSPGIALVEEAQGLPGLPEDSPPDVGAAPPPEDPRCRTQDQVEAVGAVVKVVTGQRRRPAVLISDRGRGKSAAFGIAAATLLGQGLRHIVVTAPRPEAVAAVFAQAQRLLPRAHGGPAALHLDQAQLEYVAPDELVLRPRPVDLVLVDEAAALPTPLLTRLLEIYPRIAFATTVHGYEGTGRGFALRFHRVLDTRSRGWRALRLRTPIRWAAGDPLEAFVFRALLLDAEAAPAEAIAGASVETCRVERIDRDRLLADEADLAALFGLLVLAHYRTRPQDLRNLLDGPELEILALRHAGRIVGTALLAREGGFDADTAQGIWAGLTRPHGHLLPEALAAQAGLEAAARLAGVRVMRIAVHPAVQGRGLGSALLTAALTRARELGADYLGTSFGATVPLLQFWRGAGLVPAWLSTRRDAASGEHSALMLRGLSPAGEDLAQSAVARFAQDFPTAMADPLRGLEPELADALLAAAAGTDTRRPPPRDLEDLVAFAHAGRALEAVIGPAWRTATLALLDPHARDGLDADARRLLIVRLLQHRDWAETARLLGLTGRAEVVAALRAAFVPILARHADGPMRARIASLERAGAKRNKS